MGSPYKWIITINLPVHKIAPRSSSWLCCPSAILLLRTICIEGLAVACLERSMCCTLSTRCKSPFRASERKLVFIGHIRLIHNPPLVEE